MGQPNTVTVKILDKEYKVACPEEQEAELVVSAKYLDKQMRSIRENEMELVQENASHAQQSGNPHRSYQAPGIMVEFNFVV